MSIAPSWRSSGCWPARFGFKRLLACIGALLLASGPVGAQPRYQRVDHFWWLVRDVAAAERFFRDSLGFTLGDEVAYPGSHLRHIWFADRTFLEFASPVKGASYEPAASEFLRVHDGGAWKLSIYVEDLAAVSRQLTGLGLKVSPIDAGAWLSLGGRCDLPKEMWRDISLDSAPGHLAYFYHLTPGWEEMRATMPALDPLRPASTSHANGALGLRTTWLATWDLDRTAREFSFLRSDSAQAFPVPHLKATGRWLVMDEGRILLLQPAGYDSPVMFHLFARGEGVMGASIEVADLQAARRLVASKTGRTFNVYDGVEGKSILLPADFVHGVNVELFQK